MRLVLVSSVRGLAFAAIQICIYSGRGNLRFNESVRDRYMLKGVDEIPQKNRSKTSSAGTVVECKQRLGPENPVS